MNRVRRAHPFVGHGAADDLEHRVGVGEGREDEAELGVGQPEFAFDRRPGGADIDPVDIGDEVHQQSRNSTMPGAVTRRGIVIIGGFLRFFGQPPQGRIGCTAFPKRGVSVSRRGRPQARHRGEHAAGPVRHAGRGERHLDPRQGPHQGQVVGLAEMADAEDFVGQLRQAGAEREVEPLERHGAEGVGPPVPPASSRR